MRLRLVLFLLVYLLFFVQLFKLIFELNGISTEFNYKKKLYAMAQIKCIAINFKCLDNWTSMILAIRSTVFNHLVFHRKSCCTICFINLDDFVGPKPKLCMHILNWQKFRVEIECRILHNAQCHNSIENQLLCAKKISHTKISIISGDNFD